MHATLRRRCLLVAVLFSVSSGPLLAQGARWDWPEKAMNLKVLPEDTSPDRLRATMRGFTGALGVRCNYCHVGEEGKPLSTFDFVSDENPNKDRAREMLRMLGSINGHLRRSSRAGWNAWVCAVRPVTRGARARRRSKRSSSPPTARRPEGDRPAYTELRERYYGGGGLDFGEHSLNSLGYELLESSAPADLEAAIAVLQLNAEQFPKSGNAWDSLAEAYAKAGKDEIAEIYYRKSVEVDPGTSMRSKQLRALQAAAGAKSGGE